MSELSASGFDSVVMHFRGCSGNDNRLPRSYHSGDSGDALEFITNLKQRYPNRKLYAIGYSLGANMLLKLLGELGENKLLAKAVCVSAPMLLDVCANKMNKGFSRYYQHRLLKDLKFALDTKYDKHNMQALIGLQRDNISKLKTFWQFDDVYTAPIHGFKSAEDYYAKSSAKRYLKTIQTPTLIIHSLDDPFMTPEVIPTDKELSKSIRLELTQHGGHVGFIAGSIFKPSYWLEKRVLAFFQETSIL